MREVNRLALYRQIADEMNISQLDIEDAVKHQFKFVANTMKRGDFKGVRLPYFGKFWAKKNRIRWLKKFEKEK